MAGGKFNTSIKQGKSFLRTVTYKPGGVAMDLTGSAISGKMRLAYDDTVSQAFTVVITDAVAGKFTIGLTAVQTAALAPGNYGYDIELVDAAGFVKEIIYGTITVPTENNR